MQNNTELTFKRRGRIGFSLLDLKTEGTCFVQVSDVGVFTTKGGDDIDYFDVVNLKTGEEQRMWVDGGLRGALSGIGGITKAKGMKLEITYRGQKPFTTEGGDNVKVNAYDLYELN